MARKPWDQLSPDYRNRLLRKGITERKHTSGVPLHKARGKISRQHESSTRQINIFSTAFEKVYPRRARDDTAPGRPWNAPSIRSILRDLKPDKARKLIEYQLKMQKYYDDGDILKARRLWETRDRSLPDWMFFYHGAFA